MFSFQVHWSLSPSDITVRSDSSPLAYASLHLTYIVIGLSLDIHSFIHLSFKSLFSFSHVICFPFSPHWSLSPSDITVRSDSSPLAYASLHLTYIVIGLSLDIHSFIHLSFKSLFSFSHVICFPFRPHWSLSPSEITVRSDSSPLAYASLHLTYIVIGLSLDIHSFIHLSFKSLFSFSHVICFSFRPHWSLSPSDITVRSDSSPLAYASLHLMYILICLSLDIHSFIHLSFKSLFLFSFMICFSFRPHWSLSPSDITVRSDSSPLAYASLHLTYIVIGLSLDIHSFIHLSFKSLFSFSHVICFPFRPHWSLSPSEITVRSDSSPLAYASLHLTYIVIGLSLDIHSFIHLRTKSLVSHI